MHNEVFLDEAGRVADGQIVDWPAVTASIDFEEHRVLAGQLSLVARIAAAHRQLHDLLPPGEQAPGQDASRWGDLDLLNVLGRGSYGTVYRAWDKRLERLVALKLFHGKRDANVVMREGRMLARVRHENVVTVYGADIVNGTAGMWMELVHGPTLDQVLKTQGVMPARAAATVGLHVARALSAVHAARLLHCDVKAQNVVREATGRVVLMDMGAGRPVPEADDLNSAVIGTPRYMAPELFEPGAAASKATDLYALGVLLYYLVSGRFPVEGQRYQELKQAHRQQRVVPLHEGPAAYVDLVMRSIDPDPGRRPTSAEEMAQALLPIAHPVVPHSRLWGWALAASVAVAGAGLWRYATISEPPAVTTVAPATRSIGVLPIKNLTGDASKTYLADGLTEVLISNLARVRAFRVPSFAAVTGPGNDNLTPATLASKLGVQLLLTGSVAQADSQFRMAVQLIDPTTGVAIWGEEIVREASAMLSAQADIARFVAERLAMTLSQDERQALQARTIDPRAQELYLRGLAIRVTQPTGRRDAARLFRQATEVDASFAAAWADLALVEVVLNNEEPPPTRRARGAVIREMAERAIRLDPAMASGYAALGTIQFYDLWDFKSAEATFRKALTVDPSHGFVRQRLSMLLAALGRVDEAIAMAQEAVQVEPVVPARAVALAAAFYYARDYDRAEAELRRARQLSPGFAPPLFTLGQIAAARGRYDEAESFLRQALAGADYVAWQIELARISALAGRLEASEQVLNQIGDRQRRGEWVSPDNFAYVAAARGRHDEAFRILNDAVDQRAINVLWLAVDPRVDALRSDARFDLLLRKAGLRP